MGFIARRNFFCTLSSLEQHWYGNNSTGLRIWALATAVAIALTQTLVQLQIFDPTTSIYLTPNFGWMGAILGGILFGLGMALVGTCGYGALVRLGGGSLKSLMAILVLAIAALSTQRGMLAYGRINLSDNTTIDLETAGDQSITTLVSHFLGWDASIVVTLSVLLILGYWIFKDKEFRTNQAALLTGIIVGSIVCFGWYITTIIGETSFEPVQIESASFVAPVSDTILQFALFTGSFPDYGVGMVLGVVAGSAMAAKISDNVQWEACDDARELKRHIVGATFMGFGGVLALGCTIGQGISAASLLSVSAPIVMISIMIGARMGLAYLFEGSFFAGFRL